MHHLAIFASGSGSNAEQIIKYFKDHPRIKVGLVLTNNPKAGVLARAEKLQVPTVIFNRSQFYHQSTVLDQLIEHHINAVILAGFLWLVPGPLISHFQGRMLNIHPALLPKYGGKGMYGMHVHQAVLAAGEAESGITIHEVNEEYDRGKIIFQATCAIEPQETPGTLVQKIHALEHQHFPAVIESWLADK